MRILLTFLEGLLKPNGNLIVFRDAAVLPPSRGVIGDGSPVLLSLASFPVTKPSISSGYSGASLLGAGVKLKLESLDNFFAGAGSPGLS